jgi:hypothetical protein
MATNNLVPAVAIARSVQVALRNGSSFTHTATFARRVVDPLDAVGVLVVEAICCNDPTTASRHRFPNDITTYSVADIQAEIADHIQRTATHHASVHKAQDFIDGLLGPGQVPGV